jgi:succinate dehydrogenase/fumarate reductase flavoprotein subunit
LVFGKRAGAKTAEYVKDKMKQPRTNALERALKREEDNLNQMLKSNGNENPHKINNELRKLMPDKAGIFRDEKKTTEGLAQIRTLKERFKKARPIASGRSFNLDKVWFLEIKGNLDVAEALMAGALARKESRGSHFRRDFPTRDDANFMKHTIAIYTPEGPKLSYRDVSITKYQPEERKY